jgi:diketogulonate reductase-like aldo/keto reductase
MGKDFRIRYPLQKGAVVLPKATSTVHIEQNSQLDFEISNADVAILDAMRRSSLGEAAPTERGLSPPPRQILTTKDL